MSSVLLAAIAFALILGAAVCYGAILFLDAPTAPAAMGSSHASSRPSLLAGRLTLAGIILLVAAVGANCLATRHSPFAGAYGTELVTSLVIAVVFSLWDRRTKMPAVGSVAMLLNCIILSYAITHSHSHVATDPLLRNPVVSVHVLAILAAYALIFVAVGCAVLYLVQNRLLKAHSRNRVLRRLPPLTTLDTIAFQCVAYALPLLTLSLVVIPLIFAGGLKEPTRVWFEDARFVSTAILWMLFSGYLAARLIVGWRGVRLQYLLLFGILCAFAAYALPTASAHIFN